MIQKIRKGKKREGLEFKEEMRKDLAYYILGQKKA
jgi:hypothetical protein